MYNKDMKRKCRDCLKNKTVENFSKKTNGYISPDGTDKSKTYISTICKKCMVIRTLKWQEKKYEN